MAVGNGNKFDSWEFRRIYAADMHKHERAASPTRSVALVGARGYSGLELARILLRHPEANLKACFATDGAFRLADYLPHAGADQVPTCAVKDLESHLDGISAVFLATPAEASLELAPRILAKGVDVIDLSGAFRLQEGTPAERVARYQKWYGFEHPAPELLAQASFGIVPFAAPAPQAQPGRGRLISNPGCYASAVMMATIPLLRDAVIDPQSLVIDAKSGTSGAGRKAAENLLFTEVEGECLPYRVGRHQHLPEIIEWTRAHSGVSIDPMFTTHLLSVRRGIIAGIYCKLAPGKTPADAQAAYARAYEGYPLVRYSSLEGASALAQNQALSLKRVVGSARTHIHFQGAGDRLYVFSLIDNLVKGAAGQAVENFNRLQDLPVGLGLTELEGVL